MRAVLVTGSDTGIGKTWVAASLARLLAAEGARVQVVKAVETGAVPGAEGDAGRACRGAGERVRGFTLASFPQPLAPAAAAAASGRRLTLSGLAEAAGRLPDCEWRIFEGAGGIAAPLDEIGTDWGDFGAALGVDAAVVVVADRLGAISQGRLAWARAREAGLRAGLWLNALGPPDSSVAASNRALLRSAGVPIWAEQKFGAELPEDPPRLLAALGERVDPNAFKPPSDPSARYTAYLADRERKGQRRHLRVTGRSEGLLNLADNDYLDLAHDPAVGAAAAAAIQSEGTSASASPLITGWKAAHARLLDRLCAWHGFSCGLLWSSGYAANGAILATLPARGDRVLADRLIHHSMIAGLQRGVARWRRYPHLDLDRLEAALGEEDGAVTWVATESLFSMDGDYPDLARLAELKRRHGFRLVLDEAHALGWYGPEGAGLARAGGAEGAVDVLVGTLGKALASGGAYTLFRDPAVRDYLVNQAGEFIYSTALPPAAAAAGEAALGRIRQLAPEQGRWHEQSRGLRAALAGDGWSVPAGDSPIVPVILDEENAALSLAEFLRGRGILSAPVRPPTVPAGTSRLRLSLKRTFGAEERRRLREAMADWRQAR